MQMAKRYMKKILYLVIGKCKVKPWGNITLHLLEWLLPKEYIITNVGKHVEKKNIDTILGE
jgi:hypothetical protein